MRILTRLDHPSTGKVFIAISRHRTADRPSRRPNSHNQKDLAEGPSIADPRILYPIRQHRNPLAATR